MPRSPVAVIDDTYSIAEFLAAVAELEGHGYPLGDIRVVVSCARAIVAEMGEADPRAAKMVHRIGPGGRIKGVLVV